LTGEGAIAVGRTYLLGFGGDFYGVWDRRTPGPPLWRFPRTDQGWSAAWDRFVAIEPRHEEIPSAITAHTPMRVSTTAKVGLVLVTIASAMALAQLFAILVLVEHWWGGVVFLVTMSIGTISLGVLLVARWRINRSHGALTGRNLVVAGLVIAGVGSFLVVVFAAMAGSMNTYTP